MSFYLDKDLIFKPNYTYSKIVNDFINSSEKLYGFELHKNTCETIRINREFFIRFATLCNKCKQSGKEINAKIGKISCRKLTFDELRSRETQELKKEEDEQ